MFSVTAEFADTRLDKLLTLQFPDYSRTYFQYLIENGCVLVNGEPLKKREKPCVGDEIDVCFLLTPEIALIPENIPLDILYEDEHLIAINKPSGMVTHPAPGHPSSTFVNALLHHCHSLPEQGLRPGIVHRLDKETSGILIAAKTREAHQSLISLFSSREVHKTYLAICVGNPGSGTIDTSIARHPTKRKEMAISSSGRPAITEITVLDRCEDLYLIEARPITGRTHQIRVHLKSRNAPVLGDAIYGSLSANQKYSASRQLLHATKLSLLHPIFGTPLNLHAPLPADLYKFTKMFNTGYSQNLPLTEAQL